MIKLNQTLLLFIIIILEGYVVLSSELMAIRLTVPYIGSGTDTVSIIIAAVLMPLAFGYHAGGQYKPRGNFPLTQSVRKKLIFNIAVSQLILLIGLSYVCVNFFFDTLIDLGVRNRLIQTTIYSALFLVTPVYLLGQTIPLASNYFSRERLPEITGRVLFFSTMGSFMGAVFSTLVLMATIGVHYTATLNIVILSVLIVLLSKRRASEAVIYSAGLAVIAVIINSGYMMSKYNIVENNQYNTIRVVENKQGDRLLHINNNTSSKYNDQGEKLLYVEFLEEQILAPLFGTKDVKSILVVGAGGFTFGAEDEDNIYHYVDIDSSLKDIAEKHILKKELGENKTFFPLPVRAFFKSTDKKYDVIILDTFQGAHTIPEHLITKEFFQQVKEHLNENGIVAANYIMSPNFSSRFSRHIDSTFRNSFPFVSRHVVFEDYNLWNDSEEELANVIYMYRNHPEEDPMTMYTDNKNTVFMDKPSKAPER